MTSTSDVLAGELSKRKKMRERFTQVRARVFESWRQLEHLLGDELGKVKSAEGPVMPLEELQASSEQIFQQYQAIEQQLAKLNQQRAGVEQVFQTERLRRHRRRVARFGLLFLLLIFMALITVRFVWVG